MEVVPGTWEEGGKGTVVLSQRDSNSVLGFLVTALALGAGGQSSCLG